MLAPVIFAPHWRGPANADHVYSKFNSLVKYFFGYFRRKNVKKKNAE